MRLFFSVGEPSGDQHAAHLIGELRRRRPDVECLGFGGPEMVRAGFQQMFPLTELAVMGFLRVVPLLAKFWGLYQRAKRMFRENPPDAVVLVDFPGFNWWIAAAAKRRGIPVFYYCPPQLWAWAGWRIWRVRRYVDHVLCTLPFEMEWYRARGVPAVCVGHPFFDEIADKPLDAAFLAEHAAGPRYVAILPGSRNHEVHNNFPIQCAVIERLAREVPGTKFLVACYKPRQRDWCAAFLRSRGLNADVVLHVGRTSEILELADVCLMVSGSVSLEVLARRTPAVVLYQGSRAFAFVVRRLITCKYMSLPNLVADRELMPEFKIAGAFRAEEVRDMAAHLQRWLESPAERDACLAEMRRIAALISQTGATARVAGYLSEHLPAARPALRDAA